MSVCLHEAIEFFPGGEGTVGFARCMGCGAELRADIYHDEASAKLRAEVERLGRSVKYTAQYAGLTEDNAEEYFQTLEDPLDALRECGDIARAALAAQPAPEKPADDMAEMIAVCDEVALLTPEGVAPLKPAPEKPAEHPIPVYCPRCVGTGKVAICPDCDGKGWTVSEKPALPSSVEIQTGPKDMPRSRAEKPGESEKDCCARCAKRSISECPFRSRPEVAAFAADAFCSDFKRSNSEGGPVPPAHCDQPWPVVAKDRREFDERFGTKEGERT